MRKDIPCLFISPTHKNYILSRSDFSEIRDKLKILGIINNRNFASKFKMIRGGKIKLESGQILKLKAKRVKINPENFIIKTRKNLKLNKSQVEYIVKLVECAFNDDVIVLIPDYIELLKSGEL